MARRPDPALRKRILEEAEHLIHLRGYRDTSLGDIAACCGMSKANLIHHFHSKEDLGLAVLDLKIECYRRAFEANLRSCEDPLRAVASLFEGAAKFHRGNGCKAGCFIGNIALEMSDVDERFRERADRFFQGWIAGLEAQLRSLKACGCYAADFDPRSAAEAVLALYEGATMLARTRRDPGVFRRAGRQARRLLESERSQTPSKDDFSTAGSRKGRMGRPRVA